MVVKTFSSTVIMYKLHIGIPTYKTEYNIINSQSNIGVCSSDIYNIPTQNSLILASSIF